MGNNPQGMESIEKLKNAARKAADLSRQLLAYSGRGRFKMEPVPVNQTIRDVADMLRISLSPGQRILFHLDPGNPSIQADPTQFRQVIMNLLTNAGEALHETTGSITFTTSLAVPPFDAGLEPTGVPIPNNPMVMVEVRDEGHGFSEETRQRLFEPFYSTKFTGRGLGMPAVLGIIKGHHGFIQVQSAQGEGTTVRVWFPASEEKQSAMPSKNVQPPRETKRALVVDDEPMVCDAVAASLHSLGWEVLTALDGPSAMEKLRVTPQTPTLALVDLTMPHLDGRQTAKLIRNKYPSMHILIMSGAYARSQDDPIGFADVDGFLPKPFSISELKQSIQELPRSLPQ
jgi:CheY-like chemotaxis protein